MSATVTYKGNTLTTVNNETKILETAGTWLEDDLTIADVTESEQIVQQDVANSTGITCQITGQTGGGGDDPVDTIVIRGTSQVKLIRASNDDLVKFKIDVPILSDLHLGFQDVNTTYNGGIEEIEIVNNNQTVFVNVTARMGFNSTYSLKKINFNNIPLRSFYQAFEVVHGSTKVPYFETVLGLNFSGCGGANYRVGNGFKYCSELKNVTLKANTLGQLDMIDSSKNWLSLSTSPLLTDESLISIANGLCATYVSTLALHNTSKARCGEILGSISSVTDDTGTYNFFTANQSGNTTLTEFITVTKGWTLS